MYVVYNGSKLGIYTCWAETSKVIIRFSGIIHRAFTNRIKVE
ncbi:viroplasmin family protein [Candidatus Liberibacter asiaticus]